jgi:hypothetical protein
MDYQKPELARHLPELWHQSANYPQEGNKHEKHDLKVAVELWLFGWLLCNLFFRFFFIHLHLFIYYLIIKFLLKSTAE